MATAVNTSTQRYFGFDPRTIPGCILWLDAADPLSLTFSSGSNISSWADKSGLSNNASQVSSTPPVYSSATRSVVFNAPSANFIRGNLNASYSSNASLFMVASYTSNAATPVYGPRLFIAGVSNAVTETSFIGQLNLIDQPTPFVGTYVGTGPVGGPKGLGTNIQTGVTIQYSTPFVYTNVSTYNTSTSAFTNDTLVNGLVTANGTGGGTMTPNSFYTSTYNRYSIGGYVNTTVDPNGDSYNGNIYECILISSAITVSQRQQMEGYLAWKWGLQGSLPATGHLFRPYPIVMSAFQPTDISMCVLWLDAADLSRISPSNITSGTAITQWRDKSASGTSAVPERGVSGVAPVFSNVGGVPSIFINNGGVNANYNASTYAQLQVQSNIQTTADYSVFAVVNLCNVSSPQNQTIYSNRRGGVERAPQLGPGSTFESISTGPFRLIEVGFMGTGIRQTSLVSTLESFVQLNNGAAYGSVVSNLADRFTTDADPLPTIGGTFSSVGQDNRFTTGHFHELIVYNKALTSSERQQVEGYLANKWEVPSNLPIAHPYYARRALPSTALIPPFIPTVVSNLTIWIDPADSNAVVLSGSSFTSIRDKSPNQAVFNQGTTRPTNITPINGLTTMDFQGGNNSANVLATTTSSPYNNITQYSLFIVKRPTWSSGTLSQSPCMFGIRNNTTSMVSWHNASSYGSGYLAWNGSAVSTASIPVSQNELLLFEVIQGASSYTPYKNGLAYTPITYSITARTGLPASIGNSFNGNGEGFQGQIAEVVFFSRTVTELERQQVEGYLAWKWGLQASLPVGHPFRSIRP